MRAYPVKKKVRAASKIRGKWYIALHPMLMLEQGVTGQYWEDWAEGLRQSEARKAVDPSTVELEIEPVMPPFPHQRQAIYWSLPLARSALFADPGTGKTYVSLQCIATRIARGEIKRALVIAPKTILRTSWLEDLKTFTRLTATICHKDAQTHRWVCPVCGEVYRELSKAHIRRHAREVRDLLDLDVSLDEIGEEAFRRCVRVPPELEENPVRDFADRVALGHQVVITNYETIANHPGVFDEFDMVVLDESTMIKNPRSNRTKAIMKLPAPYAMILTGTPQTNNLYDLYAQMLFVDGSLGVNYDKFLNKFFRQPKPKEHPDFWVPREGSSEEIGRRIKHSCLTIRRDDCLNLPPRHVREVRLQMDPECERIYQSIVEDQWAQLESGHEVTPATQRSELMKLVQVGTGWVRHDTDDGLEANESYIEDITEIDVKTAWLLKWLEDNPGEKVVVWAYFRHDFERLESHLGDQCVIINGGVSNAFDRAERFKRDPSCRVMLAQPGSCKFGHTWIVARHTVYFSFLDNVEDWLQSRDRTYRIGQQRVCYEHVLLASKAEEEIWASLQTMSGLGRRLRDHALALWRKF